MSLRDGKSAPLDTENALLICDLHSKSDEITLTQLRCLFTCLSQRRLFDSSADMIIWHPQGQTAFDPKWSPLEDISIVDQREFDSIVDDFLSRAGDSDDLGSGYDSSSSAALPQQAHRCAVALHSASTGKSYQRLLYFTVSAREGVARAMKELWARRFKNDDVADLEIVVVGRVNPDLVVKDAWERKRETVYVITKERLDGVEKVSEEKINLITLSSLKFDLLKKNVRSNVALRVDETEQRCDEKAGSFVQYNCARVCSILNQFQDMVSDGTYPPVPQNVNAILLSDSQEWELVSKYLGTHTEMIAETTGHPENLSRLVQWLISFGLDFSSYYNRTHVLTDPREHLYPKMFARIKLLQKLREWLEYWLHVLDLEPLTEV